MKSVLLFIYGCLFSALSMVSIATAQTVTLDDTCTVNILNRTIQVDAGGGWVMPNVPDNMGKVRARVTCIRDGETVSGQTDFFRVSRDGNIDTGPFLFGEPDPPPRSLAVTPTGISTLNDPAATFSLQVVATYPNNTTRDVTAGSTGTNYTSSNPDIAEVSADGLVTAGASGRALITIRQDGVVAIKQVSVITSGDADGDGLPDDYERDNGLDPNDPVDALEDQDGDGLNALAEFNAGTGVHNADSDSDGISDGEEVVTGDDGFITNPLLADTDGDGLPDNAEVLAGSDPNDPGSADFSKLLVSITIDPFNPVLVYNTVLGEGSRQLTVTGTLSTGEDVDLTSIARGTSYSSSDTAVFSFSGEDGRIFAGQSGAGVLTVSNGQISATTNITVETFSPQGLGFIPIPGIPGKVDISGDLVFIAAWDAGLQIVDTAPLKSIDVGDRADPVIIGRIETIGVTRDVKVSDGIAVTAGSNGVQFIDISNPSAPIAVGQYDSEAIFAALAIHDDTAFVLDGSTGLVILDFSNPSSPTDLGRMTTADFWGHWDRDISVSEDGSIAAVVFGSTSGGGAGMEIIDVSDRANPVSISTIDIGAGCGVAIRNGYAYVAKCASGFTAVDISDPYNPVIKSNIPRNLAGTVSYISVTDKLAFNADSLFPNKAIPIIGIEEPESASQRAVLFFEESDAGVATSRYKGAGIGTDDNFVYLTTNYPSRLYVGQYAAIEDTRDIPPVVKISNPQTNTQVIEDATLSIQVTASDDVAVAGVDLYINDQIEATDTSPPYKFVYDVPVGSSTLKVSAEAIDYAGNISQLVSTFVNVLSDPRTTVAGTVADFSGALISGAVVDCAGFVAISDMNGRFSIGDVPTSSGSVACSANYQSTEVVKKTGLSGIVSTVPGGTTNIGPIHLGAFTYFGYNLDYKASLKLTGWTAGTGYEVFDLATNEKITAGVLGKFDTMNISLENIKYIRVNASAPMQATMGNGSDSIGYPSIDGKSMVGREFIFQIPGLLKYLPFTVIANEPADIIIEDRDGNVLVSQSLSQAGDHYTNYYKNGNRWATPVLFPLMPYRLVSTGNVTLMTVGGSGKSTIPASNGSDIGTTFRFLTIPQTIGPESGVFVYGYEDSLVEFSPGGNYSSFSVSAGEWRYNSLEFGGQTHRDVNSTGRIAVWSSSDGQSEWGDFGLAQTIGDQGHEIVVRSGFNGIAIFTLHHGTEIEVNGVVTTLNSGEFMTEKGSPIYRIVANKPVVVQTVGEHFGETDLKLAP